MFIKELLTNMLLFRKFVKKLPGIHHLEMIIVNIVVFLSLLFSVYVYLHTHIYIHTHIQY